MSARRKTIRDRSRRFGDNAGSRTAKTSGLAGDPPHPQQQLFAGRVKTPADPRHACTLLLKYLGARAPTEALLHAFFAERDLDRASAQFWIEAYQLIVGTRKRT
jgi:hypothetical protein